MLDPWDNAGQSPRLQIFNFITSGKSFLPCEVTYSQATEIKTCTSLGAMILLLHGVRVGVQGTLGANISEGPHYTSLAEEQSFHRSLWNFGIS